VTGNVGCLFYFVFLFSCLKNERWWKRAWVEESVGGRERGRKRALCVVSRRKELSCADGQETSVSVCVCVCVGNGPLRDLDDVGS
jgi:hypothetical protein